MKPETTKSLKERLDEPVTMRDVLIWAVMFLVFMFIGGRFL